MTAADAEPADDPDPNANPKPATDSDSAGAEPAPDSRLEAWLGRRRLWVLCVAVFAVVFLTHLGSRNRTPWDSRWTIHRAESLLTDGDLALDEYAPLIEEQGRYMIVESGGHLYTAYPLMPSLLALPAVAVGDAYSRAVRGEPLQELLEQGIPGRIEEAVASLLVAAATVLMFLIAARSLRRRTSWLLVVAVFAFCTPAWSTASRALWSNGPAMLWLTASLYCLVRAREQPRWARYAGLTLALACATRVSCALPAVALLVVVAREHRKQLLPFCLWSAGALALCALPNLLVFGSPVGPDATPRAPEPPLLSALAGNLISPGRGLLLFSPVFGLCGWSVWSRARSGDGVPPLDKALLASIAGLWILISGVIGAAWWGGHGYGPRLFTEAVPFLVFLLFPVLGRLEDADRPRALWVVTWVLVVVSFAGHYAGAQRYAAVQWNTRPREVDAQRVWDWSDPQFLAWTRR